MTETIYRQSTIDESFETIIADMREVLTLARELKDDIHALGVMLSKEHDDLKAEISALQREVQEVKLLLLEVRNELDP